MKHTFSITYRTEWGESLSLILNDKSHPMSWGEGAIWSVTVDKVDKKSLLDYTYVVIKDSMICRTEWKHHSRTVASRLIEDSWIECPISACPFPREHQAAMFDIPGFRGAGTAIPIFSLRTQGDFGIGEFRDLRPLVDWAAASGQCIIQLLPVNDTTRKGEWEDSYPYSPVSSFALNPMYIHLEDLGIGGESGFEQKRSELNSLPEIDYPRVFKAKMGYILEAFKANRDRDLANHSYKQFVKDNNDWLWEYAEFCSRRDGLEYDFYCWLQWRLDIQLLEEVEYARSKGISLKGDLPIGVSADSAEAYWHPELFNLDSTAGAPPDFFSRDGQNWGFPTYNWDSMAKDDYAWWKARLRRMSRYFDAFRIDHILGFFRIWEIPSGIRSGMFGHFNPALPYSAKDISDMGLPIDGLFHKDPHHPGMYQPLISPDTQNLPAWQQERFGSVYNDFFYHRHNEFWRRNAEKKLPVLLSATGMLACGEDLGMVPDCVPSVMEHEKILSLKMRGMEKEGNWDYLSVCATSSHDMPTLRMQCESDPEPWEIRRMLWDFLDSPSMLAIFPLQDWLALDPLLRRADRNQERINQPADPNHHWRFRIHIDINRLIDAHELNISILGMLKDSKRAASL